MCNTQAGIKHLLPSPQQVEAHGGNLLLDKVSISCEFDSSPWIEFLTQANIKVVDKARKSISIKKVEQLEGVQLNENEAYRLSVGKNNIEILATTSTGAYWALQTFKQLLVEEKGKSYIERCTITDYPAFRIRGFMQDVGRTYISIAELKREIAKLAAYKINTFHWHLTENLAWRLESKLFPILNDSSTFIRQPGQYYTLEEAKDLVDFCKNHHVLLIPEIDMPGHSLAFEKAFQHNMQSPKGKAILKQLIDEVCDTFDVPYLHIGTDEVEFTDPNFVPEMVEYVRNKGKKVISWNPGWNYKQGEIDMTQLWSYRGKAQPGIPAIDCKFHYINHFDAFADLVSLYRSRILNVTHGSDDHAGSILALWHDRFVDDETDVLLQNNFYPAMLTLSERSWKGGGTEYFDQEGTKLNTNQRDFEAFKAFEARLLWHKQNYFQGFPFAYVKQTNVNWRITDAFPNEGDLKATFPPEEAIANEYIYQNKKYQTKDAVGAGIYLRHVWGNLVPAFFSNAQPNQTAYAYTYVYSPNEQEVGLWVNFQNYSRSEMDLAPVQGEWDYKSSKIWINDRELLPPKWNSTHKQKSNEVPLTNENFEVRAPIKVNLHEGWNKVLIKLPIGKFQSAQVRLVKWMFTCVFVTPDGQEAIDNLIYSPDKIKE